MEELLNSIAAKKERLDGLRPLNLEALAALDHYYDIEITYTSNAIEGNTLGPVETTLVIEKGITVAGKPLKDHLATYRYQSGLCPGGRPTGQSGR
jgi:Fic family protein